MGNSTPLWIPFWYAYMPVAVHSMMSAWLATMLAALISSAPIFLLSWLIWLMTLFDIDIDVYDWGESTWNTRPVVMVGLMSLIFLGGIGWLCSFAYLFTRFSVIFLKFDVFNESVFLTLGRGSINLLLYIGLFWLFSALLAASIPLLRRFNIMVNSHGYLVVFACWNFIQALLYYRLRYDSKGTIRPPWTDYLG